MGLRAAASQIHPGLGGVTQPSASPGVDPRTETFNDIPGFPVYGLGAGREPRGQVSSIGNIAFSFEANRFAHNGPDVRLGDQDVDRPDRHELRRGFCLLTLMFRQLATLLSARHAALHHSQDAVVTAPAS